MGHPPFPLPLCPTAYTPDASRTSEPWPAYFCHGLNSSCLVQIAQIHGVASCLLDLFVAGFTLVVALGRTLLGDLRLCTHAECFIRLTACSRQVTQELFQVVIRQLAEKPNLLIVAQCGLRELFLAYELSFPKLAAAGQARRTSLPSWGVTQRPKAPVFDSGSFPLRPSDNSLSHLGLSELLHLSSQFLSQDVVKLFQSPLHVQHVLALRPYPR